MSLRPLPLLGLLALAALLPACSGDTDAAKADDTAADDTDTDTDIVDTDETGDTDETTPDPDADGDGAPASTDCDDADPAVYPGAADECDAIV